MINFSFFSPILEQLIAKGYEHYKSSKEFKEFQLSLRDSLRRETRFNLELLKANKSLPLHLAARHLKAAAIREIFKQPLPIKYIFPNKQLDASVCKILDSKTNQRHKKWAENIETEAELIERIWHRIEILSIRIKYIEDGKSVGDVSYIRMLLKALHKAMEKK